MKRWMWIPLLVAGTTLHAQHVEVRTPEGNVTITVEESSKRVSTRRIIREILRRLDALEEILEASPRSRPRARRLLREIRGLLALLPEHERVPIVIVSGDGEPDLREGMDPQAFERLLEQMEDASFADDRLAILKTAAAHNTFTAHQARRILEVFDFEDDRLRAAKILAPRIVDRENLHELYEAFEFSDSKEKLRAILEKE